jgi:competence protein ComEC
MPQWALSDGTRSVLDALPLAPSALHHAVLAERERWALWLPVALAAGIAVYLGLSAEPPLSLAVRFGVAGILAGAACALSSKTALRAGLALVAAVLIGFAAAKIRAE